MSLTRSRRTPFRAIGTALAAALAAALALAACTSAAGEGHGAPGEEGGATGEERADLDRVRFALDWTPNTNHTGLYVAIERGYFAEAGVEVEVLPFSGTPPDQLLDAGLAELGVSFHTSAVLAQAAGADVVTVLAPLQHWASAVAVLADSDVVRPRDLDGLVYAGYGGPAEVPMLRSVIRDDGGTGEFRAVHLGTSAYEALYQHEADFALPFIAWEGLEAAQRGVELRYFRYTDFGFPDSYAVVIDASRAWTEREPELARAVVTALRRGYELARDEPETAARILLAAEPAAFPEPDLVLASQELLAAEYMTADDGTVGTIDPARWAGYADVLFDLGLLAGPDGGPLRERPDWSTYVTDAFFG